MMYLELKIAIINWLVENEHGWQRTNECRKAFRQYIYDERGEYIIGGKEVDDFIDAADKLLFGSSKVVEKMAEVKAL